MVGYIIDSVITLDQDLMKIIEIGFLDKLSPVFKIEYILNGLTYYGCALFHWKFGVYVFCSCMIYAVLFFQHLDPNFRGKISLTLVQNEPNLKNRTTGYKQLPVICQKNKTGYCVDLDKSKAMYQLSKPVELVHLSD